MPDPATSDLHSRDAASRAASAPRWLRIAGLALLCVPIFMAEVWPGSALRTDALGTETVLLGTWVPSLVLPAGICLLAGLIACLVAPVRGGWGSGRFSVHAVRLLSSAIVCTTLALSTAGFVTVHLAQERFFVVGDASPDGCRVVAGTRFAGLHHISASLGIVQPGGIRVEWVVVGEHADPGVFDDAGIHWRASAGSLELVEPRAASPALRSARWECRG